MTQRNNSFAEFKTKTAPRAIREDLMKVERLKRPKSVEG